VTAEFKRLGKRGSYRLGQLRAQGVTRRRQDAPFTPRFNRPDHRWPPAAWLLGLAAGVLVIVIGTAIGLWFVPFAAGLAAGLANRVGHWRPRVAVPAVVVMAAAGWAVPLIWLTLRHQPDGAVARVIAALLGLPGYAAVGMMLTILVAVVQGVVGYWLGRALTPWPVEDRP
jgi:hypothetical protein